MENQPIVFNIQFTPYSLPKNATEREVATHEAARAFYDMSGEKNVLKYINTEGKRTGKFTALEYLQKNTGVFNKKGLISDEELSEMKERAKANKGNIWHGFISFDKENSYKIDTPEKCIDFVRNTFGAFFKEARLKEKNLDLMCALHLDRPEHLHIHFVFWEKQPIYNDGKGGKRYRAKGTIDRPAIDNMFVRSGIFVSDEKDRLHMTRQEALKELRGMTCIKTAMASSDEIKKEIIALAKALPKEGRLSYGSSDMEAYRGRVDKIVQLMLDYDGKARRANRKFYEALEARRRVIKNICGKPYAFSNKNMTAEEIQKDLPKYHFQIDEKNIKIIEEIEADYKRRQGNLVLGLAKFIKPEIYERKTNKQYKANDNRLKKSLGISHRKVDRLFGKFLTSFGRESELLERDFTNRLREIEEEMKREKKKEKEDSNKS